MADTFTFYSLSATGLSANWHASSGVWYLDNSQTGTGSVAWDSDPAWALLGVAAGTYTFATLPPGFTVTSAAFTLSAFVAGGSPSLVTLTLPGGLGVITETSSFPFSLGAVTALDLHAALFGSTATFSGNGNGSAFTNTVGVWDQLRVSGTYTLSAWWQVGDDYVYGADPGGATPVDAPTPRIDSIVPNHGPTSGGTSVTITGAGFWNADGTVGVESVLFDGEFPGTSVVVSDEHTLTCVTPAHWKGTKNVVVLLDFAP